MRRPEVTGDKTSGWWIYDAAHSDDCVWWHRRNEWLSIDHSREWEWIYHDPQLVEAAAEQLRKAVAA